jgi:hypothetical protein
MRVVFKRLFSLIVVFCSAIFVSSCSTDGSTSTPSKDYSVTNSQTESDSWIPETSLTDKYCNDPGDIDCDGFSNQVDFDMDGDGIPNSSDNDMDGDGLLNFQETDANGDGFVDGNDAFDADGDGTPDFVDLDPGGDGVINPNFKPGVPGDPFDLDGDGVPNGADWDKDGDGIAD